MPGGPAGEAGIGGPVWDRALAVWFPPEGLLGGARAAGRARRAFHHSERLPRRPAACLLEDPAAAGSGSVGSGPRERVRGAGVGWGVEAGSDGALSRAPVSQR